MPLDLFHDAAGLVHAFVFEIEHRIDTVLALERAEAVLNPPAREHGAVTRGGLAFDVELAGPSAGDAIFDFSIGSNEQLLPRAGDSGRAAGLDFQIAGLFQMVV